MEIQTFQILSPGSRNRGILWILFFACSITTSWSQLQVTPIVRSNPALQDPRPNSAGRMKGLPPLTLPFFDDFSDPYKNPKLPGVYPDTLLWEFGYRVWVNDGLGINPPTINVATFDGLDSAGLAYNANEIFLNGITDSLVSRKIDLTETALSNPVSLAERNSVFLSFYFQWKGNGEAPDNDDYLQVQFRNASNQWETVLTINTEAAFEKEKFYQRIVKVDGDRFFSKHFQFRFRSFGRQSGPYDTWNLDYVYLNKGRTITDLGFPDQAISTAPTSIFPNQYRAIPFYHFLNDPKVIAPTFNIFNLRGTPPEVVNYFVQTKATHYFFTSTDTTTTTTLRPNLHPNPNHEEPINDNGSPLISPFELKMVTVKNIESIDTINVLDPNASAAVIDLKINLITGDNINPDDGAPAEDYLPQYMPIDFRINDTITARYHLQNYYAYDDGVAEYAGGLITAGNVFAYQFDLQETLDDTLKVLQAFDIYFPPFGLTTTQNVDFFIFDEENGRPKSILVRIPSVAISAKGTNVFQRIRFLPALQITQNKFFIGWRQPVSGQLLVGIDNSNDTGNKMFFNTDGSINPETTRWEENTLVKGSFMVRPVFGTGDPDIIKGIEEDTKLAVYPNPNNGSFQILGKPENISIINLTGQQMNFERDTFDDRTYIRLHAPTGLYIVRYKNEGIAHSQKVIVIE